MSPHSTPSPEQQPQSPVLTPPATHSTSTDLDRPTKSSRREDIFSLDFKEKEREKSKVCFLSGQERSVLGGGTSRLDCEFHRESRHIGPGSYKTEDVTSSLYQTLHKVTSTVGYGGLASRAPRFGEQRRDSAASAPSHNRCSAAAPRLRIAKAPPPFGSAVPRKTAAASHKEDTPGFYIYDVTRAGQKREMPYDHTFGGRTRLRPHVYYKCTPENLDVCSRCESRPKGDYWFYNNDYLCRPCYNLEWNKPTKYTQKQLGAYKKIRDCSQIHQHEGTTAAIPLKSDREIWKQHVLECYFAMFQGPRKIINTEPRGQTGKTRCQDAQIGRSKPKCNIQVLFKNPKNKTFVNL